MFDDLYQEIILDHNRKPRNCRKLPDAHRHAEGHNPLCGDEVTIYLNVADGKVLDATFQGNGCAISTASVSLMTESVKGKTVEEAKKLFKEFTELVRGEGDEQTELGKLEVFSGLSDYPMRVKCATLCWHTLQAALDDKDDAVSTE